MNQNQRELRQAATEAFMEALDQLEMSLSASEEETNLAGSPVQDEPPEENGLDKSAVEVWEEAAADIEQFIQARRSQS